MRMRGADAILRSLEAEGVDVMFGIPGGAIMPTYDAMARGTTVRQYRGTESTTCRKVGVVKEFFGFADGCEGQTRALEYRNEFGLRITLDELSHLRQ